MLLYSTVQHTVSLSELYYGTVRVRTYYWHVFVDITVRLYHIKCRSNGPLIT